MKLFDSNNINPVEDDDKYHNLDYIKEVLEGDNENELKKVQEVQGWTNDEINLYSQFAKLRKEAIAMCSRELEERKKNNISPSEEELSMGIFREMLEPQVRNAVLLLRKKGYNSFESGFYDFDTQIIGFENKILEKYLPNEDLVENLKKDKVDLIIEADSITLKFREFKNIEEIEKIWEKVEKDFPDLGKEARLSNIQNAKMFREKYLN